MITTHRWLAGKWGKQDPHPHFLHRGMGTELLSGPSSWGPPEVLWLAVKELLVPRPPVPGPSFQVPPVQTNVALCLCSLVKRR